MYFDVIRAYHRMLDLKEKYINIHVLGELVCDVVDNSIDCEGLPAARFLQKTRELLGRSTTTLGYPSRLRLNQPVLQAEWFRSIQARELCGICTPKWRPLSH